MKCRQLSIVIALSAALLVACGGNSGPEPSAEPSTPSAPDPATPDPSGGVISQTYAVSECGGFRAELSRKADDFGADEVPVPGTDAAPGDEQVSEYCAAERLDYTYDALTGALKLTNARVMLNCCGEHSVTLEKKADGSYELREVDSPELVDIGGEQQAARCHCMCPFDFDLQAENIPVGTIEITIVREVTDSDTPQQEVFTGKLDLSQASGSAVVDGEPVIGFCE